MIVLIGADHAGFALKESLKSFLKQYQWQDVGTSSTERCDYPDFAELVAKGVRDSGYAKLGVLICGSGIGMSIAANKVKGVRAAHVSNPVEARLAREHNDAHIVCIGSRFLAPEYAAEILQIFLHAEFKDPQGRHQTRIEKMGLIES